MSSSQSPDYSIPTSSPPKLSFTQSNSTVSKISLHHRPSLEDVPTFTSMTLQRQASAGEQLTFDINLDEWDREQDDDDDDDEDNDESDSDSDLPPVMGGGGGMAFGGFGDDDDDDDDAMPAFTPGLIRQNGYYRSETSHDFMAEQRAA